MNKIKFFIVIIISQILFAQDNNQYIEHLVQENETIADIAKKYKVTPYDIYLLNPDASNQLIVNTKLIIPSTQSKPSINNSLNVNDNVYVVQAGDTWFGIAKKYQVSVEMLQNENKLIFERGLQPDDQLRIPQNNTENKEQISSTVDQKNPNKIIHKVEKGETKFSISKQYNVSINDINEWNPDLKGVLPEGKDIVIYTNQEIPQFLYNQIIEVDQNETKKKASVSSNSSEIINSDNEIIVKKGETIYSISKQYNISQEELLTLNPQLADGLKENMTLVVKANKKSVQASKVESTIKNIDFIETKVQPKHIVVEKGQTMFGISQQHQLTTQQLLDWNPQLADGLKEGMTLNLEAPKTTADLQKESDIVKEKISKEYQNIKFSTDKKIALLIPFNLNDNKNVNPKAKDNKFKSDQFFNMTMDFYSGIKIAIDSIRKKYPSIKIEVFDSEENLSKSSIQLLSETKNINNYPVIIGPFYPKHIEELLTLNQNSVIISPLRTLDKGQHNLVQSMTHENTVKSHLINYLAEKSQNIIALVDAKKTSALSFLKTNHQQVNTYSVSAISANITNDIKSKLSKEQSNAFVVCTENTELMIQALNLFNNLMNDGFKMQLAALEFSDVLMDDDVFAQLVKHQAIYPSSFKNMDSDELTSFEKHFKAHFKMFPSPFAIRGYDLLMDVAERFDKNDVIEQMFKTKTTQVDNKFQYQFDEINGYTNQGTYLLQFQKDLSVKVLN